MCGKKSTFWYLNSYLLLTICFTSTLSAQTTVTPKSDSVRIRTDQSVLLVDGNPFFVRAIQQNGESLEFLKSLGFNTVQLQGPATSSQLAEAARIGMFLIAPPPASIHIKSIDSQYDPVLAWSVGENVTARDQQVIRRMVNELKDYDQRGRRPVVVNVASHLNSISQLVNVVNVGAPTIATNFRARDFSDYVKRSVTTAAKPLWADIQTEVPSSLKKQVAAFAGAQPQLPVEHQQLKFQLYEALSGGARGVRFLSRIRLDGQDPESRLRTAGIRWVLGHCQQIERWAAGGLAERFQLASENGLEVHSLRLAGSQVMLVQRTSGFEQWVCGDWTPKSIEFLAPAGSNNQAYLINELGANLLPDKRQGNTPRIQIPNCPFATAILVTDDPTTVQVIDQGSNSIQTAIQLRQNLVSQSVGYLQLIEQQLATTEIGFPILGSAGRQTETSLSNVQRMLSAGNNEQALRFLEQADAILAAARRNVLENQKRQGSNHISSPMLNHFGLVTSHFITSQQLAGSIWNPNSLTAGDFENLQQMSAAGWVNRRDNSAGLSTRVSLEKTAAAAGEYGLQMSVSANGISTAPQAVPIWIESAEVHVKRGQLVRIHGMVNVSNMSASGDGLMITDSLGGPDIALRIQKTDGWQKFTIYRAASRNGKVRIKIAMTGIGVAKIDEVTIRTMDRPNVQAEASGDRKTLK